tara:strand:+ start:1600 stop:1764 length:165 start_codon:yes stop_codon:yes gene_type:complete
MSKKDTLKLPKTARNYKDNPITMDELGKGISKYDQRQKREEKRKRERKSPDRDK